MVINAELVYVIDALGWRRMYFFQEGITISQQQSRPVMPVNFLVCEVGMTVRFQVLQTFLFGDPRKTNPKKV